ncbi:Protein phosphatase 2C-like protein 4 [Psilocybe cubensis]|uniref:Protein phosphatase 2C-like protein 4 n=1 Tax=Psilocybe cubensis TaxID=181762 RepID=A0ACB8HG07_PSICU|nr:Protein phosphatase 2C-like protein 4 [Psilocybe cubensis]KAH9486629.1 Protein phosphatase 2C-like protein 4 [Psilocybe cubensis]
MAYRCLLKLPSHSATKPRSIARYHDYIRAATPGRTERPYITFTTHVQPAGSIRVPLSSPKVIGVVNSRGNRRQILNQVHQEDFYGFATLSLPPEELRLSLKRDHGVDWDPSQVGDVLARQVLFVGIYDGHGGSAVAQYLRQELHGLFESVDKSLIPELFGWIKEIGGYFKRFKGGAIAPWIDGTNKEEMTLEARATLTFFEVDKNLSADNAAQACGATASVAVLQSLDAPATPFFSAEKLALTVAHCGDTRVLLCSTLNGQVFPMTENHYPDARIESIRLRRMMGSSLITDSYGESRWMGSLANTRWYVLNTILQNLGDLNYKKFGITPEPEVRSKLLNGREWAFLVLVSDGISSILSDAEIVDLARGCNDPKTAAERILAFSEELGGEDNATAIVVPLAGWGKITGPDATKDLRAYRQKQAVGSERQRLSCEIPSSKYTSLLISPAAPVSLLSTSGVPAEIQKRGESSAVWGVKPRMNTLPQIRR